MLPSLAKIENAVAYSLTTSPCNYPSSVIKYKFDSSVNVALWKDIAWEAAARLNDIGANFRLDYDAAATTPYINIKQINDSSRPQGFGGMGACTNGVMTQNGSVELNLAKLSTTDRNWISFIIAHELGHAIGLNHYGTYTLMNPSGGYVAPTLDDISGLKTKYGSLSFSSLGYEWGINGDVTCPSSCTPSPTNEMRFKVINPANGARASATTTLSTTSLPSWTTLGGSTDGTIVMTARVKPYVLNKFSMGVYTNNNIADKTNRLMSVEMNTDGFWLVWTKSDNTEDRKKLTSTLPVAGQQYFLELIVSRNQESWAYVYKWNGSALGSATPEPTGIATSSVIFQAQKSAKSWSSSIYYGMGVWQPQSTEPKPDYGVLGFHNLKRSYT